MKAFTSTVATLIALDKFPVINNCAELAFVFAAVAVVASTFATAAACVACASCKFAFAAEISCVFSVAKAAL